MKKKTTTRNKGKPGESVESVGRPEFEITEKVIKEVEKYAALGLPDYQIAHCIGISTDTFVEKKKAYSEFSEALTNGRAKGIGVITNALFDSAKGGHFPAQKYYLNNRAPDDWADMKAIEHSGIVEHHHVTEMTEDELAADIAAAKQRLRDSGIALGGEIKAKAGSNKSPVVH